MAFAIGLVLFGLLGWVAVRSQLRATTDAAYANLEALARLKSLEVGHWVEETGEPVEKAAQVPPFVSALDAWLKAGQPDGIERRLLVQYLMHTLAGTGYTGLDVRSATDGALLLSVGDADDGASVRGQAVAALNADDAVLEDFHAAGAGPASSVRMGYFFPVKRVPTAEPIAILHATIDPLQVLMPIVQQWPGVETSMQVLLLRPALDSVELLNPPTDRLDLNALSRLPTHTAGDAAAINLLRGEGPISGRDYRNVTVLAYGVPVDGTPWRLVAKIDAAEAYQAVEALAVVTGSSIIVLLALGCLGWALHNRSTVLRHQQALKGLQLAKRIDYLAKYANDCIILCGVDGRIIEANDRCADTYGYEHREMVGMPASQLRAPHLRAGLAAVKETIAQHGGMIYETVHCRKDGTFFPVEISNCFIDVEGQRCFQAIIRDISERRPLEAERAENVRRIAEASHRAVAVQEQERRHLASELHDTTGANLAAISLNLKALGKALAPTSDVHSCELLRETSELLTKTIHGIRNICSDLRPAILDYGGLVAALLDLADNFSRRTGVEARVDGAEFRGRCSAEIESVLYRIVQEALTNCAKHADARRVHIRLDCDGHVASLTVADDGRGFAPELLGQEGHKAGLGLLTMRERAEFIGGSLSVLSRPGGGTQLKIQWTACECQDAAVAAD